MFSWGKFNASCSYQYKAWLPRIKIFTLSAIFSMSSLVASLVYLHNALLSFASMTRLSTHRRMPTIDQNTIKILQMVNNFIILFTRRILLYSYAGNAINSSQIKIYYSLHNHRLLAINV